MSKSQKHRRTQSNSEVDLKHALRQDKSEDRKHFIEIYQTADNFLIQNSKEVIVEPLEDDYELQQQKENCGLNFGNRCNKKRNNFGSYQPNNLFLIPEQNDLLSSVEQTQESGQKHTIKEKLLSNMKKSNIQDKIDPKNSSLINQIHQIQQQLGLKDITHKTLNSERKQELQHSNQKLSFTNELQKKKKSIPLKVTPDRKRIPSQQVSKQQSKDRLSSTKQEVVDKLKNNLSVSIFSNLLSQHSKKQSISGNKNETQDSFRKLESQMKRIEKEISTMRQRQDQLDEVNRTLHHQLFEIIQDSKKSKEVYIQIYILLQISSLSLQKLEQLESITRRNEESIAYIRQTFGTHNKRVDSHQTDSTEISDYNKRFLDYRYSNRAYI